MQIGRRHDGGGTKWSRGGGSFEPVVNFFLTADDAASFVTGHSARRYCRIVIIITADDYGNAEVGGGDDDNNDDDDYDDDEAEDNDD